jgi:hypothetical protein
VPAGACERSERPAGDDFPDVSEAPGLDAHRFAQWCYDLACERFRAGARSPYSGTIAVQRIEPFACLRTLIVAMMEFGGDKPILSPLCLLRKR